MAVQTTISMKLPEELKARLQTMAAERGISVSSLIKQAIETITAGQPGEGGPTCHDMIAPYLAMPDRIGASGLGDLSTDKRHFAGFGRKPDARP